MTAAEDGPDKIGSLLAGAPESWLVGGGQMGKLIRSIDWSENPLGPMESWPQSLRTTASICLSSNFPISLAWGPEHVQIYNDGYWPICGEKHPRSMGQDFCRCWESAWPVIGDAFARALAGETVFLENQRMFLDRNGFLEETFFTFSFSPIRDETGVVGLFHPVIETTGLNLSERRTRALRDLSAPARKAETIEQACKLAAQSLESFPRDVPFVLFYLFDEGRGQGRLTAAAGLSAGSRAAPASVDFTQSQNSTWPLATVKDSGLPVLVEDLGTRFGYFSCGEYPESPNKALVMPMTLPGRDRPVGAIIAGVSSRLSLDESYQSFHKLLQASVITEVANACGREEEQNRTKALMELDRAKMTFFSNVSHEFRTPLTLMLGPLEDELAEDESPLPAPRKARLEMAHRNTVRILKLVNNLLDFSRIEAARVQVNVKNTDLAAYTAELASMFRSVIEKAGLALIMDCPPLPRPAYVDRDIWEKIVLNLLSNALKHTFEGSITVSIRARDSQIELRVADTGVGIPAAELPRLFERFHRVKDVRSRTHEGAGIGLALVKELAALHGGVVHVASEEGKGSVFTVTVTAGAPLALDPAASPDAFTSTAYASASYVTEASQWLPTGSEPFTRIAQTQTPGKLRRQTPPRVHKPRILLVDDNADMRDYLSRLLNESCDVVAVGDGKQALVATLEQMPDLVISDVMMPGMDGLGLLRALKTDRRTRMIPVILLSARTDETSAIEGLNAGADDYLAKPFSGKTLLARIRSHLEPARVRRAWATTMEQTNRELEAFNYSVSHDLRSPLRAIDGYSKALLDECAGKLSPSALLHLHRIRGGTQKMAVVIDDLLTLSHVNHRELRKEQVDLSALGRRVFADLRTLDPPRKVAIAIADGLSAYADERMLSIALMNLLSNAWKYTSRRSEASIQFGRRCQGLETVFFIRDNGAGFESSKADKLFKPFQRLHDPSEFEGTGIGLATVERIIARHGGRIWADAVVDMGATFFFTLESIQ